MTEAIELLYLTTSADSNQVGDQWMSRYFTLHSCEEEITDLNAVPYGKKKVCHSPRNSDVSSF